MCALLTLSLVEVIMLNVLSPNPACLGSKEKSILKTCMFGFVKKVYSHNLHVWVRKESLFSQPACLGSKRKSILKTCMIRIEKKVYSQNLHV